MDVGHIYGGGSPTGVSMYENGALPASYNGSFFSCEPGKNTVFHYKPEPQGAAFKLEQSNLTTTNPDKKYAGSDFVGGGADMNDNKILFRPSDIVVGPDGALYISDWYDARVGGHSDRDDTCSGTIYRIAPKGFKPNVPQFDLKTVEGAITALKSPAVNTRFLGFTALKEMGEKALPALKAAPRATATHTVAARGIWLLPHLGSRRPGRSVSITPQASQPSVSVRLTAYRALRRAGCGYPPHTPKRLAAHSDPDAGVRRDVALSLRDLPAAKTKHIFAKLAPQVDITDKNAVEAIGLGAANQESEIWLAIKEAMKPGSTPRMVRAIRQTHLASLGPPLLSPISRPAQSTLRSLPSSVPSPSNPSPSSMTSPLPKPPSTSPAKASPKVTPPTGSSAMGTANGRNTTSRASSKSAAFTIHPRSSSRPSPHPKPIHPSSQSRKF